MGRPGRGCAPAGVERDQLELYGGLQCAVELGVEPPDSAGRKPCLGQLIDERLNVRGAYITERQTAERRLVVVPDVALVAVVRGGF